MAFTALDTGFIYDLEIADVVFIEICGKLLAICYIMAAFAVEMFRRPIVKRLIYASDAICLFSLAKSSIFRGRIELLALLNAISGYALA